MISNMRFVSNIEPNNVNEFLNDEFLVDYMRKGLVQFEIKEVYELVPRPNPANIIGNKWI